ncbi:MAG: hypothetical protein PUC29_04420 [Clostridia bacterium]|nr:hypothetical protein [Clostridia bacterium]
MFQKMSLKRKIKKCRKQIADIEQKRIRSQAALVSAILANSTPDDADVDYFNRYTEQIEAIRSEMNELEIQLKNI